MQKQSTSDEVAFGQLVGSYRTLRTNLSQRALAGLIGISEVALRHWEMNQNKPGAKNLQKLLEVFLDLGIFTTGKEEEEAREFWKASRVNVVFDEVWAKALSNARKPKPEKKNQVGATLPQPSKVLGSPEVGRDSQKIEQSVQVPLAKSSTASVTPQGTSEFDTVSPIGEDTKEEMQDSRMASPIALPGPDTEGIDGGVILSIVIPSSQIQALVQPFQNEPRIVPVQSKIVIQPHFYDTITERMGSSLLSDTDILGILSALYESGDSTMVFNQSKRETLQKIALSLLTVAGFSDVETFTMLNAKQQGLLALSDRTSSVSPETLDRFEQLITRCRQLSLGKQQDIALAKTTAGLCLPTLTAIAEQPSTQQQRAAGLAAQLYRLSAVLGYHTENLYVAESHARNAVKYSKIADNPNLIVASLGMHVLVFYYANRPERAVELCLEAEQYLDKTTYAIQSFLYRRKSACLGQLHEDDEALAVLNLALKTFHLQPSNEIPLPYAEYDDIEILLWEAITRYQAGQQDAAIVALEQLNPHEPSSVFPERIRTGFLNNLVFAELRKPAQQRDLNKCVMLWEEAAQAALTLQSELRYQEVARAYNELLIAFPGEAGLKGLRQVMKRKGQSN